jgi:Site-specific recombinase XerD
MLELHVLPEFGGHRLDEVTPRMLTLFYARLREPTARREHGLTPKTIRNIHIVVHKFFADALEAEILSVNPADRAKVPRRSGTPERELHFWQPAELALFLRTTRDDDLGILWHVAAMTGMRRGELLGLRWSDVDLEGARLSVRRNLISVAYRVIETTPKSNRARVIDLDGETVKRLRDLCSARSAADRDDQCDRVFLRSDGAALHPDLASQAFRKAMKEAGVRPIRFHDLRHTHATIALRVGIPAKVISERLGHSTPEFTLSQYAHVIPGMQAEAAAQIAELVRAAAE